MFLPVFWLTTLFNFRHLDKVQKWSVIFSLLWIFPLLIFLSLWVPWNEFYHLFLLFPVTILAVTGGTGKAQAGRVNAIETAIVWIWLTISIFINYPFTVSGIWILN